MYSNPYIQLSQHTKDEMIRTVAREAIFGSMMPENAERRIDLLLEAGANFVNEANI